MDIHELLYMLQIMFTQLRANTL